MPWIGWPVLNSLVRLRHRVDVVQRRIAVDDLERLADAHAEHVRVIAAALWSIFAALGRRVEHVVAEAVLDVDEHVAERLAVAADHVGFLRLRRPAPPSRTPGRRSS